MVVLSAHYRNAMTIAKRTFSMVLLVVALSPPPGAWSRGLLGHGRRVRRLVARCSHETAPNTATPVNSTAGEGPETIADIAQSQTSTSADPSDYDDHRLKRSRRKNSTDTTVTPAHNRAKTESTSNLLPVLRVHLAVRRPRLREMGEALPGFGSGPCHSIPRPREGTIDLPLQSAVLPA